MADDFGHRHAHAHAHAHASRFVSGWDGWRRERALVAIVVALTVAAVATIVAGLAVRGDGSGRDAVDAAADEVGFATDVVTAEVLAASDATCSFAADDGQRCRTFSFQVTSGAEDGRNVTLPEFSLAFEQNVPPIDVGDSVVLNYEPTTDTYSYADQDRRGSLVWLALLFAAVVVALGRSRGVLALASMLVTVVVLVGFVAPAVLDGSDPVVVAVVGASVIAFVSLFLTHGVSPSTSVALLSTLAALGLTLALSKLFFELAGFTGLASEEAAILPLLSADIDLAGLLLGGAVLGALGALDDVTVTQVATVDELHAQRPDLGWRALAASGIRIGRAHIASTVNTLLLAYAGASVPLLLLFAASDRSLGFVANSEVVAVEIVRTMCGSIGLVAAVPVATGLAAIVATASRTLSTVDDADGSPAAWEDFSPEGEFWE